MQSSILFYGFPPRLVSCAVKSIVQGDLVVEHGNKGRKKLMRLWDHIRLWDS